MRFLSFEVEGFKNLVAPVRLDELGAINVLHGENNVGKSNVLRAMAVFFVLLEMRLERLSAMKVRRSLATESLREAGVRAEDLFNYAAPKPIRMTATLGLDPEEIPGGLAEAEVAPSSSASTSKAWRVIERRSMERSMVACPFPRRATLARI